METVIYQMLQLFVYNVETPIFLQLLCLAVAEIVETHELNHSNDYKSWGRLHLLKACHGYTQ